MNEFLKVLDSINFTTSTLFIALLLPFSFFAYSSNYFYDQIKIKTYNFINVLLSIFIIAISLYKIFTSVVNHSYNGLDILSLHVAVCFLSMLILGEK